MIESSQDLGYHREAKGKEVPHQNTYKLEDSQVVVQINDDDTDNPH